MNLEKLTQKSRAALADAQRLAADNGNYAVEPLHLFLALLSDGEGLVPEILSAVCSDAKEVKTDAMRAVAAITAERDELAASRDEALAQRDMARAELERVVEQIKIANARLYAPRTEKVPPEQMSLYLQLFNGAEADADGSVPEPAYEDAVAAPQRERRRGGRRRYRVPARRRQGVRLHDGCQCTRNHLGYHLRRRKGLVRGKNRSCR